MNEYYIKGFCNQLEKVATLSEILKSGLRGAEIGAAIGAPVGGVGHHAALYFINPTKYKNKIMESIKNRKEGGMIFGVIPRRIMDDTLQGAEYGALTGSVIGAGTGVIRGIHQNFKKKTRLQKIKKVLGLG